MGWFAKIAWALGMWICGSCVMSWFGSQIRIINACTRKLIKRCLGPEVVEIKRLNKYLNSVLVKNFLIITAVSAVVIFFVPSIGITFYFIGMFVTWLTSIGAVGMNPNNIDESFTIFYRYIRTDTTESKEDIAELLDFAKKQVLFEENFKAAVIEAALEKKANNLGSCQSAAPFSFPYCSDTRWIMVCASFPSIPAIHFALKLSRSNTLICAYSLA